MAKVSQQVLMSLREKEDIVALAIVRQESQAEVTRALVGSALPAAKADAARELNDLYGALDAMKVDRMAALREMGATRLRADGLRRSLTLADLKTADGKWKVYFPWPDGASGAVRARVG